MSGGKTAGYFFKHELGGTFMKATRILWDVDNPEDLEFLPSEIEIPAEMVDEDEISDYLSDFTGFCYKGFFLES